MKTTFLILFIIFTSHSIYSQDKTLDSFLGIKWGANKETIMKIMSGRNNVKYMESLSKPDHLLFIGGTFAGQQVYQWQLFLEPKYGFYLAGVNYLVTEDKVVQTYKEMKDILTKKYFSPSTVREEFAPPYSEGDGYETQAISAGKATFMSRWDFNSNTVNSNIILLHINLSKKILGDCRTVDINYINQGIKEKAVNRIREGQLKDF